MGKKLKLILLCIAFIGLIIMIIYAAINFLKLDTKTDEDLDPVYDSPVINFYDGQEIELSDLSINWQECSQAIDYVYNIILLDSDPDYGNNNETSLPDSIVLTSDMNGTKIKNVEIDKSKLIGGKWVKIAIAARYENNTYKWNSIYIKIKG